MIGHLMKLIKMNNKKITIITTLIWFSVVLITLSSCVPTQSNCGTKGQHKARQAKTRTMAPSMAR